MKWNVRKEERIMKEMGDREEREKRKRKEKERQRKRKRKKKLIGVTI